MFQPSYFLWVYMGRKLYQKTEFNDSHSVNKFSYLWYPECNKNVQKLNFCIITELYWLFLMSVGKQISNKQVFFLKYCLISGYVFIKTVSKRHCMLTNPDTEIFDENVKIFSNKNSSMLWIKHNSPDIPNTFKPHNFPILLCHDLWNFWPNCLPLQLQRQYIFPTPWLMLCLCLVGNCEYVGFHNLAWILVSPRPSH